MNDIKYKNMKIRLCLFTALVMFLSQSSCISAQNNPSDKEIIAMLNEFYVAYSTVWSITPPPSPDILDRKIDSIQEKYCTLKLRTEAKKYLEDGHDLMTNDLGIGIESLKTLIITKDSTKADIYIVSYITTNTDAANKPIKQKITLKVAVVKGKEGYKINDVK